jgi:hypothetical protein
MEVLLAFGLGQSSFRVDALTKMFMIPSQLTSVSAPEISSDLRDECISITLWLGVMSYERILKHSPCFLKPLKLRAPKAFNLLVVAFKLKSVD